MRVPRMPSGERERSEALVPSVLPQVLVTVNGSDSARISVDGVERPGGPVDRARLGSALASIAEHANSPVRVEIQESDGSRYADILQPPRQRPILQGRRTPSAGVVALRVRGFAPGETVLIAVPITSIRVDADGTACLPTVPAMPRRAEERLLLGSTSRRTVRGRRTVRAKSGR